MTGGSTSTRSGGCRPSPSSRRTWRRRPDDHEDRDDHPGVPGVHQGLAPSDLGRHHQARMEQTVRHGRRGGLRPSSRWGLSGLSRRGDEAEGRRVGLPDPRGRHRRRGARGRPAAQAGPDVPHADGRRGHDLGGLHPAHLGDRRIQAGRQQAHGDPRPRRRPEACCHEQRRDGGSGRGRRLARGPQRPQDPAGDRPEPFWLANGTDHGGLGSPGPPSPRGGADMRIVVFESVTLDGVMQAPGRPDEDTRGGFAQGGWAVPYADELMGRQAGEGMATTGGILLGRRTYEDFYGFWPKQPENPFTEALNKLQKYVVSNTLTEPLPWENSSLLQGVPAEAVATLKEQPGNDLLVLGSGELVRMLTERGLVDRYVLLIHPLVLGSGRRLFTEGTTPTNLRLTDTAINTKGVIIATYETA